MFSETSSNSSLAIAGCVSVLVATACYFCPPKLLRWIERKRYQYEVTFSLYMMTPTEKFIFNSILFLFLSMVIIAASLYLPEHIAIVTRRAFYYVAGDYEQTQTQTQSAAAVLGGSSGVPASVKDAVETVRDALQAGAAKASAAP